MFPMFMMPPINNSQKSIKDQLEEYEALLKFLKDKEPKKDEKKPDWKQHKFNLLETAILMLVAAFLLALPTTIWIIHELAAIKAAILAL